MQVLRGLTLLLALQVAGELLARALGLPLPGPVIGMLMLLPLLALAPLRAPVQAAADALLGHLSLLFVPVGVGVLAHVGLLRQHGLALISVLVISTCLGMVAAGLVMRALGRPGDASGPAAEPPP